MKITMWNKSFFVYAGLTVAIIANTMDAAPRSPAQDTRSCCFTGQRNSIKIANTETGLATNVKNTAIATTLTAHVYKGATELTGAAITALGTIKWYKDGGTTSIATGQTFTVSAGDVTNKATYTAQLEG